MMKLIQKSSAFINKSLFKFSQQNLQSDFYDITVSGAGPVGLAFACALANCQYFQQNSKPRIIVLDPSKPVDFEKLFQSQTPDHKVVSVSKSTSQFIESIGADKFIKQDRTGEIHQMQVWEDEGSSYLQFDKSDNQGQKIGSVVEVNHITSAIYQRLKELNNVELIYGDQIENITRVDNSNIVEVTLKLGQKFKTRLLVGSDGKNSAVKKLSNMPTYGWNYGQYGIVCSLRTNVHPNTAWQKYLRTGPIGIIPLWEDYFSLVWSCDADTFKYLMKQEDDQFLDELNNALSKDKGQDFAPLITQICNKRLFFPLQQFQSNHYISPNVALIGDAAHSIHPQAGQGLNMGMNDAVTLANCVIRNLKTGNNIGEEIHLKEYELNAQQFNYSTALGMEFIKKSYELNSGPFSFLRNVSVNILNNSSALKQQFINNANFNPLAPRNYEWL